MIAQVISALIALSRLAEILINLHHQNQEKSRDAKAILTLRTYRERLEVALAARRAAHRSNGSVDGGSHNGGLPDDGFRRD